MKRHWFAVIFILLFILAIPLEVFIADHLWGEKNSLNHTNYLLHNFRYHFTMIANNKQDEYWKQVQKAAGIVAKSENIAIEYYNNRFSNLNTKELEKFLEVSILSRVDAILISVPNEPSFQSLINEAYSKKIPLIVLANDIDNCKKTSFIGINTYDLGVKTGRALSQAMGGVGKIAALVNSGFAEQEYQKYLKGLKEAIAPYPQLELSLVIRSKGESLDAEEQTQTLLKNHPEIQAIVCTDSNDTLGVSKVVIDLNRVTQITIIGKGLTAEISSYIKRGVIWGVVVDDPNTLGTMAVSSLYNYCKNQPLHTAYYLPLYLITSQNVDIMSRKFKITK